MIVWGMIIFYKNDHLDLLHDSEVATVTKVAFAYMWLRTSLIGLVCTCSFSACIIFAINERISARRWERQQLMMGDDDTLLNRLVGRKQEEKDQVDAAACSICLLEFSPDSDLEVVELACNEKHIFHRNCLADWVKSGNRTCPLCRQYIE